MNWPVVLIIAVMVLVLFAGVWWNSLRMDKKLWNSGGCPCGRGRWVSFDTDSAGATGYNCTECRRSIWIGHTSVTRGDS